MGAPYIYDISRLRVKQVLTFDLISNKNSTIIKLGTGAVNVLCQL